MTMMTTAEYAARSTTRSPPIVSVMPMFAKINPTSPRGIMPIPTLSR
jgi:hypothetical protein